MEMQAKINFASNIFAHSLHSNPTISSHIKQKKQEHYDEFLYFWQKSVYMELPVNLLTITARKVLLLTNN